MDKAQQEPAGVSCPLAVFIRPLIQLVQDLIFAFNGFSYTYTARALKSHMVSEPGSSEPELSFRKSTALISAQTKPLKSYPSEFRSCRRRDLKPWSIILSLKPFLSVPDGESLIGSKGGWRGVMNLKPKLLVQELVTSGYKKDEVK
ncbi:hypothetical protein YC2023_010951 [Brassica napus]